MNRIIFYAFFVTASTVISIIYYRYVKPGTFNFKSLVPFVIFFGVFIYFDISGAIKRNQFYKNEINSIIIKSSNWQVRTTEFYLKDGFQIHSSFNSLDLQIGDSIVKKANTTVYDVYRKDYNRIYVFLKKYDSSK